MTGVPDAAGVTPPLHQVLAKRGDLPARHGLPAIAATGGWRTTTRLARR